MNIKRNIKQYLFALLILVSGAMLYQETKAVSKNSEKVLATKDNFGILLRKGNHLKVAVRTADEIQSNPKFNVGKFEIIVCGQEVEKLKNDSELTSTLEKAAKLGVKVKACGISLQKFGVSPNSLHSEVQVTPNGLMRAFELEKEEYLTIEL